jgi:2-polyprenyl-3-methyl-5-hydroxy-6-metoxy-1,4-benzoquinol methylase
MTGYIEDTQFDIYECNNCLVSFVDPLASDDKIYRYIYEQANRVPGYERYYRYMQLVKKAARPFALLCAAESCYWAINEALQLHFTNKNINILEIGSGLGYLTYSLNKAGYSTVGVDISAEAVSNATKVFGSYYELGDIFIISREKREMFDCVIMTEIIEHVADPLAFIECALSMLKKGGKLIFTTPNKSFEAEGTIWATDAPPVHLWWFSENCITTVANKLGKKIEYIDFTEFNKKFYEGRHTVEMKQIQATLPRLSKSGKVIEDNLDKRIRTYLLSAKARYILSYIRRRCKKKTISNRTFQMCAVLS